MSTNKLDCAIARELLALYHEGILGEQASSAVKEHVEECAECGVNLKEIILSLLGLYKKSPRRAILRGFCYIR